MNSCQVLEAIRKNSDDRSLSINPLVILGMPIWSNRELLRFRGQRSSGSPATQPEIARTHRALGPGSRDMNDKRLDRPAGHNEAVAIRVAELFSHDGCAQSALCFSSVRVFFTRNNIGLCQFDCANGCVCENLSIIFRTACGRGQKASASKL